MKDRYARLAADALQRMSGMTDRALDFAETLAEVEFLVGFRLIFGFLWGQAFQNATRKLRVVRVELR